MPYLHIGIRCLHIQNMILNRNIFLAYFPAVMIKHPDERNEIKERCKVYSCFILQGIGCNPSS